MIRNVKKTESHISVDLDEPLTGHSCTQLVIEFLKYIMFQKQQIPMSCDTMIKFYSNSKPTDRNFSSMQSIVNSLCNVSNHLASQFALEGCDVKEIIVAIGATIVSPKLCIRFEIPSNILDSETHFEYQHCYRKPLLKLMRSIFDSSEFQDEMTVPLGPTNTFILIHKKDPRKISEFFIPKPQFSLPLHNTTSFCIKFNYNENQTLDCNCKNLVKVYNDQSLSIYNEEKVLNHDSASNISYQWYQSKETFKGFKFIR